MPLEWTPEARAKLDLLLIEAAPGEHAAAIASRAALRDRIEGALEFQNLSPIRPEDVEDTVQRLGLESLRDRESSALPRSKDPAKTEASGSRRVWYWLTCVIGPLIVLMVEQVTGMCAEEFFDPIPTLWHSLLVLCVAIAGALGVVALRPTATNKSLSLASAALGFAVPIASLYFIAFLPLAPLAAFAVILMGMGLLALAPIACLPSLVGLSLKIKREAARRGLQVRRAFWIGVTTGAFLLVLNDALPVLTRNWVHTVATGSAAERSRALWLLRTIGSESMMRRLASDESNFNPTPLWMSKRLGPEVTVEQARAVWFRTYGTTFRGPLIGTRPGMSWGRWRWNTFDSDLGGTTVGMTQDGLSLEATNLDVAVDGTSGVAYMEWVFEVSNSNLSAALEARALLALPDEAVVSRATLWVAGEEREAAYSGSAAARAAYQQVAVRQQRDPLLVGSAGDDLVLMQAFPVNPGQKMKWKIGITMPLEVMGKSARVPWPRLVDRNFALGPNLTHSVWVSSHEEFTCEGLNVTKSPKGCDARGRLAANAFDPSVPPPALSVRRNEVADVTCALDATQNLTCTFGPTARPASPAPVVVIEASHTLRTWSKEIAQGLREVFAKVPITVVVAEDVGARSFELLPGSNPADLLDVGSWKGGVDCVLALEDAWDRARELGTDVIWMCGPQPMLLSPVLGLDQRFTRDPKGPRIICCMLTPGENRVLTELGEQTSIERVGFSGDVTSTLRFARGNPAIQRQWSISERPANSGSTGQKHLVALWAASRVEELLREVPSKRAEAIDLAKTHHLVTQVTSAVVLETAQQFAENGLTPAEAEALPSVPEPEVIVLLLVALGAMLWVARRPRKGLAT